jgi:predicted transglutaminase-like cysteine proteinase
LIRFATLAKLLGLFFIFGISLANALDFDRLQQVLISKFGVGQANVLGEWRQTINANTSNSDTDKLRRINDFFNRRIAFADDISIWGQSDYWATPIETIGQGRGDCEDFAIAKYFSLLNLGVPMNKLRLVYVKALQNGPGGQIQQAHMVLAYYASPNGDPLVLDNLVSDIRPASKRADLSPVFSFNSAGLWQGTGNQSSKSNLSRWQDLLARARAEGFQ